MIQVTNEQYLRGMAEASKTKDNAYRWALDRIAELEAELAEVQKDNPENDGTSFAHPAWWRGQEAGDRYRLAAVVTELSLILGVEIATDDLKERWAELKRLVAEARKDSERLDKLISRCTWTEGQRQRGIRVVLDEAVDAARGAK